MSRWNLSSSLARSPSTPLVFFGAVDGLVVLHAELVVAVGIFVADAARVVFFDEHARTVGVELAAIVTVGMRPAHTFAWVWDDEG